MTFLGFVLWAALTVVLMVAAFYYGGRKWQDVAEAYQIAASRLLDERNEFVNRINEHVVEVGDKLEAKRDAMRKEIREEIREALDKLAAKLGV